MAYKKDDAILRIAEQRRWREVDTGVCYRSMATKRGAAISLRGGLRVARKADTSVGITARKAGEGRAEFSSSESCPFGKYARTAMVAISRGQSWRECARIGRRGWILGGSGSGGENVAGGTEAVRLAVVGRGLWESDGRCSSRASSSSGRWPPGRRFAAVR